MRIWHADLIPKLCPRHLVAVWREALGAYIIIAENRRGYRNHPALREFVDCPEALHARLTLIRAEADRRGYRFKALPARIAFGGEVKEWQSIAEQVEVLKSKQCKCYENIHKNNRGPAPGHRIRQGRGKTARRYQPGVLHNG